MLLVKEMSAVFCVVFGAMVRDRCEAYGIEPLAAVTEQPRPGAARDNNLLLDRSACQDLQRWQCAAAGGTSESSPLASLSAPAGRVLQFGLRSIA